jgi:hypothetical protein
MKMPIRAALMILIFTGSIFCKAWIYSQSQVDFKNSAQMTSISKACAKSSKGSDNKSASWNRLFKSRRRIEKYGFIQKAMSPPIPEIFYSVITFFRPEVIQKPEFPPVMTLLPPPRARSLV